MPKWIHDRADHIRAKNPGMPKSESFAIATQQAHASGNAPKDFGTSEGKQEAKSKYDKPKSEYEQKADPSHKAKTSGVAFWMGFSDEFSKIAEEGEPESKLKRYGKEALRVGRDAMTGAGIGAGVKATKHLTRHSKANLARKAKLLGKGWMAGREGVFKALGPSMATGAAASAAAGLGIRAISRRLKRKSTLDEASPKTAAPDVLPPPLATAPGNI